MENTCFTDDLLNKAQSGDIGAQNDLGLLYHKGISVKQDYSQALRWFSAAAAQNSIPAMYNMGITLRAIVCSRKKEFVDEINNSAISAKMINTDSGEIMPRTYGLQNVGASEIDQAVFWFSKAAESCHVGAMAALADIFEKEKRDLTQCCYWHEKAAANGNENSLVSLGILYASKKEWSKSFKCYRTAGLKGNRDCISKTVEYYLEGVGTERDYAEAVRYGEAARKVLDYAEGVRYVEAARKEPVVLSDFFQRHYGASAVFSSASDAVAFLASRVKQNDSIAAYCLAEFFVCNFGRNSMEVARLYELAAQGGVVDAMYKYYDFMYQRKTRRFYGWLTKAAEAGHVKAMAVWGKEKLSFLTAEWECWKAFDYLYKAATKGETLAIERLCGKNETFNPNVSLDGAILNWATREVKEKKPVGKYVMGLLYFSGRGVEQDYGIAFKWFNDAVENKYDEHAVYSEACAMFSIGKCYEKGLGVPQNLNEAMAWYRRAWSSSIDAMKRLGDYKRAAAFGDEESKRRIASSSGSPSDNVQNAPKSPGCLSVILMFVTFCALFLFIVAVETGA